MSSEIELEKLKHSFEMKHLDLMGQLEVQRATFKTELEKQKSEKLAHARDPKLPYFEESKDKMDSYLSRFEKYATANKWDKNVWAAYLSALLKGRALDVYDRLSTEDAADYDKLKDALLKNFDMTERGFRKKFRYSRLERSETFIQFSSRLCSYLNKWLTMAKVEKSFEAVCDFMARDQFLEACSRELFVHLKPKAFENLDAMAKEADLFAEARGGVFSCVNKGQRDNNKAAAQSKPESKPSGKPEIKCGICGKGHLTIRCYKNPIGNKRIVWKSLAEVAEVREVTLITAVRMSKERRLSLEKANPVEVVVIHVVAVEVILAVAVSPTGHLVVPGTK